MYVYCVKSFAHIECYSDCSRRGSHLVEPFSTVLLNSVCYVECYDLYPCCMGVFAVMEERRLFSSVFAITERRDMACMRYPCLCLCWVLG